MAVYEAKAGDTEPLEARLTDRNGPVALFGVGTVVKLNVKPENAAPGAVAFSGVCTILDTSSSESRGRVRYSWAPGQLQHPGVYRMEFEVTFADGMRKTFPNREWDTLIVYAGLD